jgi:hypothetical protein
MHPVKTLNKFQNYWSNDDNFRYLIYSNFRLNKLNGDILTIQNPCSYWEKYSDLNIYGGCVWFFMCGLIFPAKSMVISLIGNTYFDFGKEIGGNGRWLQYWEKAAKNKFDFSLDFGLSSYESGLFGAGKNLCKIANVENRKSYAYLLGRDAGNLKNISIIKELVK